MFRGTIDFKNGSAGSTGSEQETVLLLGDDVVNRTVPLILCAEENVEAPTAPPSARWMTTPCFTLRAAASTAMRRNA